MLLWESKSNHTTFNNTKLDVELQHWIIWWKESVVWEHFIYFNDMFSISMFSIHVNHQRILIMLTEKIIRLRLCFYKNIRVCDSSLVAQRQGSLVLLMLISKFPFAGYFKCHKTGAFQTAQKQRQWQFKFACFQHTWGNPSLQFNWKQHVWLGCLTPTSFCRPWCVFCTFAFAVAHPSEPIEQLWTLMKQIPWTVTQKSNVRKKNLWCSERCSLTAKFIYLETARKDILITYTHPEDSRKKNG